MMMGVDAMHGHGSTLGKSRAGRPTEGLSNLAGKHINSAKEYSGRTP